MATARTRTLVRTINLSGFTGDAAYADTQAADSLDRWQASGKIRFVCIGYSAATDAGKPVNANGLELDVAVLIHNVDANGNEYTTRTTSAVESSGERVPAGHEVAEDDIPAGSVVSFSILSLTNPGAVAALRIYADGVLP